MTAAVKAAAIRYSRSDARPAAFNGYIRRQHGVYRWLCKHTFQQRTVYQLGKPEKVLVGCNLIRTVCVFVRFVVADCAAAAGMVVIVIFRAVNRIAAQYRVGVRTDCLPPLGRGGFAAACGQLISDLAAMELLLRCRCFAAVYRSGLSQPIAVGGCSAIIVFCNRQVYCCIAVFNNARRVSACKTAGTFTRSNIDRNNTAVLNRASIVKPCKTARIDTAAGNRAADNLTVLDGAVIPPHKTACGCIVIIASVFHRAILERTICNGTIVCADNAARIVTGKSSLDGQILNYRVPSRSGKQTYTA